MTPKELAEWRNHPVTAEILVAIKAWLDRMVEAQKNGWWMGSEPEEGARIGLHYAIEVWETIANDTADDFKAMVETDVSDA